MTKEPSSRENARSDRDTMLVLISCWYGDAVRELNQPGKMSVKERSRLEGESAAYGRVYDWLADRGEGEHIGSGN